MSNRHVKRNSLSLLKRSIVLRVTDNRRVSYHQITFDPGEIIRHDSVGGAQWVNLKELMLIPKTVREVERCLLLLETGRAVLAPNPTWVTYQGNTTCQVTLHRADLYEALRLLIRLIGTGSIGKASVAHVLTMLGGPMERMESWGPPGSNKRRPCKVRVTLYLDRRFVVKTALLGSVENMSSADDI